MVSAEANGGGVAFFAHVGGFVFGVLVARLANRTDRPLVSRGRTRVLTPDVVAGDRGAEPGE